jgi:hypothetical protein
VRGSFDFGRSWHQPAFSNGTVVNLPGIACTDNNRGVLYNDAVYLVGDCSTEAKRHGSAGYGSNDYWTYVSRDPALTSWTTLKDRCKGCNGFSVERMAVPFDGTGTLILVNPGQTADVWWQSATGNYQSANPGQRTVNTWTAWSVSSTDAAYTAPRGARVESAPAADAEGLVLIASAGVCSSQAAWGCPNGVKTTTPVLTSTYRTGERR